MNKSNWKLSASLAMTWCAIGFVTSPLCAERWTDLTGANTIEAQFIGLWDGKVILQKTTGQRMSVPMAQLNAPSRLKAEELLTQRTKYRKERLAEIVAATREADPTQPLEPTAPFKPIPNNASLQQAFDHTKDQLQAGHPEVIWDWLPLSYRKDITEVVHLAAAKTDQATWQPMLDMMESSSKLLKDKQEFILKHPVLVMLSGLSPIPIREAYDPFVGLLIEAADPKLWTVENMRQVDFDAVLKEKGPRLGGFLRRFDRLSGQPGGVFASSFATLKFEQPNDMAGVVTQFTPQGTVKVDYVRVENRWVPKETADSWNSKIAETISQIEQWGNGVPNPLGDLAIRSSMAKGAIDQLLATTTQSDFNEALRTIAGQMGTQLAPLIMPHLAGIPGAAPEPGTPGSTNNLDGSSMNSSSSSSPSSSSEYSQQYSPQGSSSSSPQP